MSVTPSVSGGSASVNVLEHRRGTKEELVCSGQGLCNSDMGLCNCFPGWRSSNGAGGLGNRGDCGARDALSAGNVL